MAELKSKQAQPRPSRRKRQPSPPSEPDLPPPEEPLPPNLRDDRPDEKLEKYCLGLILANPSALAIANDILEEQGVSGLGVNDFKRGVNREIFKSLNIWTASETPKLETLVEMVGQSLDQSLAGLASQWHRRPPAPLENIERDLSEAILRLRLQNIADHISELSTLQHNTNDAHNHRGYIKMVEQYKVERRKLEHIRDALSLTGKRRLEANQYGEPIA